MQAVCIRLKGDPVSEAGYANLLATGKAHGWAGITAVDAILPSEVDGCMRKRGLRWTYPWDKPTRCPYTGLLLTPYKTRDPKARMACFLSHFYLWELAADRGISLLILEDDAEAIAGPQENDACTVFYGAVSINDPRGATRRAAAYHDKLQAAGEPVTAAPWVDDNRLIPQGLPGNSAYQIHHDFPAKLAG